MTGPVVAPTFPDVDRQARFEADGFVVVDLLDPHQVAELRALFDRLDHPVRHGFFATNETDDVAYKREMTAEVQRVLGPAVRQLLPAHRLIGGYFVVKWPGADSEKGPHVDWSLVDEGRFRSVSVWVPLVDTTGANGSLCCLRGSHHLVGATHRGSPDFPTRGEVEAAYDAYPAEDRVQLDLRAGQAVVYSHQTIHFSSANQGPGPRPAVNVAAVPAAADLVHFRMDDAGRIEKLTVDDAYFEAWAWSVEPPAPRRVEVVERIDQIGHFQRAARAEVPPGPQPEPQRRGPSSGVARSRWRRLAAALGRPR